MKLRDFLVTQIDAPFDERRKNLHQHSRCVASLYGMCFGELLTDDTWRIVVACNAVAREKLVHVEGVTTVEVAFDHTAYDRADIPARRRLLLDAIHLGATTVAKARSWPLEPFERARAKCLEKGIVTSWSYGRKTSPSRKRVAQVRTLHDEESFRCWLEAHDRNGELLGSTFAFEAFPSEHVFVPSQSADQFEGPRISRG